MKLNLFNWICLLIQTIICSVFKIHESFMLLCYCIGLPIVLISTSVLRKTLMSSVPASVVTKSLGSLKSPLPKQAKYVRIWIALASYISADGCLYLSELLFVAVRWRGGERRSMVDGSSCLVYYIWPRLRLVSKSFHILKVFPVFIQENLIWYCIDYLIPLVLWHCNDENWCSHMFIYMYYTIPHKDVYWRRTLRHV